MRTIGVGLLGLGNVGSGVVDILRNQAAEIEARLGARVEIRRILVRERDKPRATAYDPALITTHIGDVLDDAQVAIVVELIGGREPAGAWTRAALERGKHVVTANKALLAEEGESIFSTAVARQRNVYYEAAVCGGIPILRTIRESLAADRIDALYGIVNGTTNFILSQMTDAHATYDEALRAAQQAGYAEADPTLDVGGGDAAQKLCILAALAFGIRIKPSNIYTEGIDHLDLVDLTNAGELGYAVKLLASARRVDGAIEAHVCPTLVPRESLLATVGGAFNAVLVVGQALGPALFYGQGAGGAPTGTAVVGDIIDCCRNILANAQGRVPMPCEPYVADLPKRPMADAVFPYYLRFTVDDRPGVLAAICGTLGARGISIGAVSQRERSGSGPVPILVVTHEAREGNVKAALAEIDRFPTTRGPARLLRIESRPPVGRS